MTSRPNGYSGSVSASFSRASTNIQSILFLPGLWKLHHNLVLHDEFAVAALKQICLMAGSLRRQAHQVLRVEIVARREGPDALQGRPPTAGARGIPGGAVAGRPSEDLQRHRG